MAWEFHFLDWISENLHSDFLTPILRIITSLGDYGLLWIILAILLLIIPKTRRCGLAMAISLALCGIFGNLLLKPLIARTRPYDVNTAIELLIPRLTDFSFPSGHTYSSFAGAVVLLCYYRKTGIAALLLAICISFSRLYFYVHYPTDIIVGILMGVGFSLFSVWLVNRRPWKRLSK